MNIGIGELVVILLVVGGLAGAGVLAFILASRAGRGAQRRIQASQMLCGSCRGPVDGSDRYCRNCGARL